MKTEKEELQEAHSLIRSKNNRRLTEYAVVAEEFASEGEVFTAWAYLLGYSEWFCLHGIDIGKIANKYSNIGFRMDMDNEKVSMVFDCRRGKKHGLCLRLNKAGSVLMVETFKNGLLHGLTWHKDGKGNILRSVLYINGGRHVFGRASQPRILKALFYKPKSKFCPRTRQLKPYAI